MRPLVLHNGVAEALLWGSFLLWFVIESVIRRRSRGDSVESEDWTYSLMGILLIAGIAGATVVASTNVAPLPGSAEWVVAAGVILLWLGVAFRLWAIFTLGRFFKLTVTIQEGHRVVDRGPYRWLRHPSYTGALLAGAGIGLALDDWLSIVVLLGAMAIAYLIRIPVEERALLEEFGEDYADYAARTSRLVPGLF
ncbi:MAG: isoprenylcysteine carboxylmethyltransferase family protein [Solirubrobacteraceae bacterium]